MDVCGFCRITWSVILNRSFSSSLLKDISLSILLIDKVLHGDIHFRITPKFAFFFVSQKIRDP